MTPSRYARPPSRDPRYIETRLAVEMAKETVDQFESIHPTAAHLPEEEFFFFEGAFLSHTFAVMADAPSIRKCALATVFSDAVPVKLTVKTLLM
eukprot:1184727-Prorocentrum_minimum.AAC.4